MNFYTKLSGYLHGNLYKFLLVMRLTIILIIAGILQVSAKTTYGQKLTLNQKSISIKQVFKAIKNQTGYDILWQPDRLDASQMINANFNGTPLVQVIKECIAGKGLTFEIEDQSIILKNAPIDRLNTLRQDSVIYKGKITDESGKPMGGATVKIIGSSRSTFTTSQGNFSIYGPLKGTLQVSYIGYLNKEITLNGINASQLIIVNMVPGNNNLGEVSIVSNGYQDIAKERATGSFEVITKEQLQHSSDPNLVKRLEGITTSMNFNNTFTPINTATSGIALTTSSNSPIARLTIRGRNSLNPLDLINNFNTSGQVLVVIDGIASPYSIDQVNPNDVESISILKDAAAASIWGSKAANGVIVVKTKRGGYDRPLNISFNTNFNLTEKLNLFYKDYMSTSEYVDAQIFQFNKAGTNVGAPNLTTPQVFLSPVAEILNSQKQGQITQQEATTKLDILRGNDIRKDFDKYIIRQGFTQSYSLAFDGGGKRISYRLSGAYDNSLNNSVGSGSDRISLNYNTSVKLTNKLDFIANINYSQTGTENQAIQNPVSASIGTPYYLYTRLADDQGNPLAVPYRYRPAFVNLLTSTYKDKILDLSYVPLNNINEGYYKTDLKSLNFNLGGIYRINSIFSANILYNYNTGRSKTENLEKVNSFYMRNLITQFTTPSNYTNPSGSFPAVAPLTRQIPLGGLYTPSLSESNSHTIRGQLNINKNWNDKHELNAIAGVDVAENYSISKNYQYYGYNEDTKQSNNQLDFFHFLSTLFADPLTFQIRQKIPYVASTFSDYHVRTSSIYSNASYTYLRKYTLSTSVRKDLSSEFGKGTNQNGIPFYSIGGSWNIANEEFYQFSWLPRLQLRTTFGYNGNVNPSVNARPIITYSTSVGINNLPYATTDNQATNNELRPEKTGILNVGLDFGTKNNRISGSLEYYDKRTTDLISGNQVDPSTGYSRLTFNSANMHGWGTDLTLNSQNLQSGLFSWNSSFLFSYNRVKITKLYSSAAQTAEQVISGTPNYNEGYDLSRLFAFKWAGLDPVTGNPRGFLNGAPIVISDGNSYNQVASQPISSARYFGSDVPVYYGSLRNTFNYGAVSVSVNFLYKLGYYFRRPISDVVRYGNLFNTGLIQGAEFSQRWQKPGDEVRTNVPSMIYPGDGTRDLFYMNSEINVLKADHIRLQEINISYSLSKKNWFLKNPRIYANISNLGVIWRANRLGLDPDINDYPNPRTYAFGLSANF